MPFYLKINNHVSLFSQISNCIFIKYSFRFSPAVAVPSFPFMFLFICDSFAFPKVTPDAGLGPVMATESRVSDNMRFKCLAERSEKKIQAQNSQRQRKNS